MLSRHNSQPGESPAEEPQKLDEQAMEHFLAVLDGGALNHRASEWGMMALRGGSGIVTGCEVCFSAWMDPSIPCHHYPHECIILMNPSSILLLWIAQVLLRDIVGAVDDEDEAAANKLGRPCGAMIQTGTMAYKCLVQCTSRLPL